MVLSHAKPQGWQDGENPAVWRGHPALMLPARGKIAPVVHHAALYWRETPAFMAQLRKRAEWTIPAGRMNAGQPHRVPLSAAALTILREMAKLKDGSGLVFIGSRKGVLLSDMTLTAVLRRMGKGGLTAHGFRSTFRDWAAEATAHPNHVVEQALAHAIGLAVEAAYRRGDLIAKRRVLMDDWAAYLAKPAATVVRGRFVQKAAPEVVA